MAGFDEVRIDLGYDYGTVGGPRAKTQIVRVDSGREQRSIGWVELLGRWDIGARNVIASYKDYLIAFFRARQGPARGFRFKDWADYRGTYEFLGTGDDSNTTFQLVRHYQSGSADITRTIRKPVAGTVKVYVDGVEQVSGWTVDDTTGVVSFVSPPAAGATVHADFEFDVPVRFDTDSLELRFEAADPGSGEMIFFLGSLPVVELLL